MLCPQCRRMVGKDGYCPMGHLVRPEIQEKIRAEEAARWGAPAAPPSPPPAPPPAPVPPESDPYTPPGLGPSNPPPQPNAPQTAYPPQSSSAPQSSSVPPPAVPGDHAPTLPPAPAKKRGGLKTALGIGAGFVVVVLAALIFLGTTVSAANLKYIFTRGETHRYQMSMTMDVRGGNLLGGGNFNGSLDLVMRQTVKSVDGDGVATIEFAVEKLRITEGGRARNLPAPPGVIELEMTPDGRVLDTSGSDFLGDINPAAGLFGPESFSPRLARKKVDPGDSWSIGGDAPNPFGEDFHIDGTATFVERTGTGAAETAVIKSLVNSPLHFRIELKKLAEETGEALPAGIPDNAAMRFDGNLAMNLTQAMAKSGFMKSALGDMKMTGTFAFENVPQIGNLTGVLNMSIQLTMTALS